MTDAIQIVTTVATRQEAEKIAQALVTRRLAACVQISGPVVSTYRWQGSLESAQEWVCTAKTLLSHFGLAEHEIRARHTYEVPEILALPIVAGSEGYLNWLRGELMTLPEQPADD